MTALVTCAPLAEDSEIPAWHRIGEPNASVACRYDVENNDCDPIVLKRERIRR